MRPKRPRDTNQLAKRIVDISTGEAPPDPEESVRVRSGRAGGVKGGVARANKLSAAQRSEIAKAAASARWKKGR